MWLSGIKMLLIAIISLGQVYFLTLFFNSRDKAKGRVYNATGGGFANV
jgi:hypothetical protein